MIDKTVRYRKPDLLLLLTFFVGIGFLATSLAQAATPFSGTAAGAVTAQVNESDNWWRSTWGLELARKMTQWRSNFSWVALSDSFQLARSSDKTGFSLHCSSSLPETMRRGLRDGGDKRIGAGSTDTDVFVFMEKRW